MDRLNDWPITYIMYKSDNALTVTEIVFCCNLTS